MRDAEFGQWSWLFASVKSSDCAQHFWRDEVSGLNVLVVHMSPRRVKVALSPWEEWGDRQLLPWQLLTCRGGQNGIPDTCWYLP